MPKSPSAKPGSAKTEITHPNTGRRMKIDTEIHTLFSKAILSVLKKTPGISFTELVDGIERYFSSHKIIFQKSVSWYAVSIKYDLETRGLLETYKEKGKLLNRLK
jgi:hypothetical protein